MLFSIDGRFYKFFLLFLNLLPLFHEFIGGNTKFFQNGKQLQYKYDQPEKQKQEPGSLVASGQPGSFGKTSLY